MPNRWIDSLTEEELRAVIDYIGSGIRPIRQGRALFPGKGRPALLAKALRNYAWNKLVGRKLHREGNPAYRTYLNIQVRIFCDDLAGQGVQTVEWPIEE
jgi:hypothetical protein